MCRQSAENKFIELSNQFSKINQYVDGLLARVDRDEDKSGSQIITSARELLSENKLDYYNDLPKFEGIKAHVYGNTKKPLNLNLTPGERKRRKKDKTA